MQVLRADVANEVLDVMHIVRQVEGAILRRHHAGIDPVRHIDLVVLQQGPHRVAQQGCVVSGQRGAHQHHRLVLQHLDDLWVVGIALETQQLAEGLLHNGLFHDGNIPAVAPHRLDVEGRLLVILAQAVEQFVAGSHPVGARHHGQRAERIGEGARRCLGQRGERQQHGALEFVELVKHGERL